MDGCAFVAAEVRSHSASCQLRAIAMLGLGQRAHARHALQAGFNAHLPKPALIEELRRPLRVCEKRESLRQR
ncbi:response regulator [Variovorax sp. RCC_210]|uniref:response regulator n=1 Tax=Variovorax sp. RCC_210 TaxID=3239217 RepID=UPI0014055132